MYYSAKQLQKRASLKGETSKTSATEKGSMEALELQTVEAGGSTSASTDPLRKHFKVDNEAEVHSSSHDHDSCVLEFDGASKGNPGQAGAGAVLWTVDGSPICRLRKGLGHKSNNVAEYEALILGLEHALKKGYTKIRVLGDSKLVCFQLQGKWKVRHWMMSILYEQAKTLENKFVSFQINHFLREHNSEADAQANLATMLGETEPDATDVIEETEPDANDVGWGKEDPVYPQASVSPAAPTFTLLQPRVVVYDGVCHLCHGWVKWVIEADKHRKIKFCCLQSKAAEPYLKLCGLEKEDVMRRFLFVEGLGLYHQGSTAALRVVSYLPLPYSVLSTLFIVPTPVRDAVYDYVAQRRYKWFGKANHCLVLNHKELLERFIDRDEIIESK
ncbi:hypothetical protein K2173_008278 [Erythroxylum novogranatense]|uniref:RNase H type-1 domain-containing protein n=1 Tax=Erythroxylum novogranatense TaxID=1862640 RepID=A0AAV8U3J7_9ROSI|nr:hypothetical protein K2173_008278 [Erythroxylum novogranatense]